MRSPRASSKASIYPEERRCKALSDEKRLKILALLTFREMCVCELTAALGLTQPNLSHHVKKLEYAGLVRHEKRGKWVYYFLTDAGKPERLGLA